MTTTTKTRFMFLGVAVDDGTVSIMAATAPTLGELVRARQNPRLGPLAGSHAEVTAGASSHRVGAAVVGGAVFLPLALVGLSKKSKASAFVITPDGTVHERPLKGARAIRAAQAQAVRFNALAGQGAVNG